MESVSSFLLSHGIRLKKDLGQHFLVDPSVLSRIIETAAIDQSDHIVEIGPGIGVLTKELMQRAAKVTAIEFDARLIPLLEECIITHQKRKTRNVHIVHGDALTVPLPTEPYKIVANIPYHITSPLLRHIFRESPVHPKTMTLLMQREVAEKIQAAAKIPTATGSRRKWNEGNRLGILVGLFGTPKLVKIVPPGAFFPPPKVDSAILHVSCFPEPLASGDVLDAVFRLTKDAFSQKRKMLRSTVGRLPSGIEHLEKAGIDPMRRPQTLFIHEWIALARLSS